MTSNEPSLESVYPELLNHDPEFSGIVEALDREARIAYGGPMPVALRTIIECMAAEAAVPASRQSWSPRDVWNEIRGGTRRGILAVVAATAIVAAGSLAYAAGGGIIRVQIPEQMVTPGARGEVSGFPQFTFAISTYRAIDPRTAAHDSGLPVAYLSPVPAEVAGGTVETSIPPPGQASETGTGSKVEFTLRSAVRYRANGHTVVVELTEPSAAIIAHYHLWLGDHSVQLPGVGRAWTQVLPEPTPYIVTFVSGPYLVGVASDLSMAQTEDIASAAVVSPEVGNPAGIPGNWPAPLPVDTPIPGVQMEVYGSADHYVDADGHPGLAYQFAFRNIGMEEVHDEAVSMILPPGLAFAGTPPVPFTETSAGDREWTWPIGSGYGSFDDRSELAVTDATAFDRGLEVRVSWTENGVAHQKTFHFPIGSGPAHMPIATP
jgi:hypothetical protein